MILAFCDKSYIVEVFLIIKTIFKIACYLAPVIVIIVSMIHIFKTVLTGKEDDFKDSLKVTVNRIIAGLLIAFLPALINYIFTGLFNSSKVEFLACFESASKEKVASLKQKEEAEREAERKKQEAEDEILLRKAWEEEQKLKGAKKESFKEWQRKHKALDFSCTSDTVKSQFSCESLKIVEKHLYDLNAQNFYSVINSYGGFDKYAKSLGGVYGDYYGNIVEGRSVKDFQRTAEYVLGWMYMYGWDYESGALGQATGEHRKWGGGSYTPDAFYAKGGWLSKYRGTFDEVISGKYGTASMASECGDLEIFIYQKMGIDRKKQLPKVTRLKDLRVGDGVYFGREKRWNKLDESTWKSSTGGHNVIVGEVYDDRVVFYDAGGNFQYTRNYKRTVYIPKEDNEEADYAALQKEFGDLATGWGMRRWYNFEQ